MNIKKVLLTVMLAVCLLGSSNALDSHPSKAGLPGNDHLPSRYFGMCAASAAVPLGPNLFIVGDDENNVLRVYSTSASSIIHEFTLSDYPVIEGKGKKIDVEGGTRLGNYIFWIGSHSTNEANVSKPGRRRLFAHEVGFTIKEGLFKPFGKPYTTLLDDITKESAFRKYNLREAAGKLAETEGALNIEGLSSTPDGMLLIGFRNPITNNMALIVPLRNPMAVIEKGAPASFGDPIELDLGGLGIRDIASWEEGKSYIIIAGPSDSNKEFRLYEWTGRQESKPEEIKTDLLAGIQAEALAIYPSSQPGRCRLQILSDDEEKGDIKCDPTRGFRSVWIDFEKHVD